MAILNVRAYIQALVNRLHTNNNRITTIGAQSIINAVDLQNNTVTLTESEQRIKPDDSHYGLYEVVVPGISKTYIGSAIDKHIGTTTTINPTFDGATASYDYTIPKGYHDGATKVRGSATITTVKPSSTSVTPSEKTQSVTIGAGYTPGSTISIGAISTTYVGSGISRRNKDNVTVSVLNVEIPNGYYAESVSKTCYDGNLTAGNIKKGVSIFGITGTYDNFPSSGTITNNTSGGSSSGTITAGKQIKIGKGYYANDIYYTAQSYTYMTNTAASYTDNKTSNPGYTNKVTFTPSGSTQYLKITAGYTDNAEITIKPIPYTYYTNTKVSLSSSSITPSESSQTVTIGAGYTDGGTVTIKAIPTTHVGSGIARITSLTKSGGTIKARAGYYASELSQTVSVTDLGYSQATSLSGSRSGTTYTVSIGANKYTSSSLSTQVTPRTLGLTAQGAASFTPGTSDQVILKSGLYLTGDITMKGVSAGSLYTSGTYTYMSTDNYTILASGNENSTGYYMDITIGKGYYPSDKHIYIHRSSYMLKPVSSTYKYYAVSSYSSVSKSVAQMSASNYSIKLTNRNGNTITLYRYINIYNVNRIYINGIPIGNNEYAYVGTSSTYNEGENIEWYIANYSNAYYLTTKLSSIYTITGTSTTYGCFINFQVPVVLEPSAERDSQTDEFMSFNTPGASMYTTLQIGGTSQTIYLYGSHTSTYNYMSNSEQIPICFLHKNHVDNASYHYDIILDNGGYFYKLNGVSFSQKTVQLMLEQYNLIKN